MKLEWVDRSSDAICLKGKLSLRFYSDDLGAWYITDVSKKTSAKAKDHLAELFIRGMEMQRRQMQWRIQRMSDEFPKYQEEVEG